MSKIVAATRRHARKNRWRVVESVVAAIQRVRGGASGWVVTQNAMVLERGTQRRRQVDVFVCCPSGEETFRVGLDVKDEHVPLDIEKMEQLCAKGGKLDVDRYVVVSTGGYTAAARAEAARCGVLLQVLRELDAEGIFKLKNIRVQRPRIHEVLVVYPEGRGMPTDGDLRTAWLESEIAAIQVPRLAESCLEEELSARSEELRVGVLHELRVLDSDHVWRQLYMGGRSYPPPEGVGVRFEMVIEEVPAEAFAMEDGREALSAELPVGPAGELRQVTLVTDPIAEGGFKLVLSVGDVKPQRRHV